MCPRALDLTLPRNSKLEFVFGRLVPTQSLACYTGSGLCVVNRAFYFPARPMGKWSSLCFKTCYFSLQRSHWFSENWLWLPMTLQSEGKKICESWLKWIKWNADVSFCLALTFAGAGLSLLLLLTCILHCSLKISTVGSKLHFLGP